MGKYIDKDAVISQKEEQDILHKYKVKLYTKYFEVPLSLSCENVIGYAYITAKDISEVKDIIYKRFNDRKEIIGIEEYE